MKGFVYQNKLNISLLIFIIFFFFIHYLQPECLYNTDGSFREFGVGYKHKTIFPMWIVAILLAVLSYYSVLYYLAYM